MVRGGGSIDVETVSRNQMEPVFAIDADGTIAFANERFYAISGLSAADVIGTDYDIFERIVEDDFAEFRSAAETVLAGESTEERVEMSMIHPQDAPVSRRLPAETRITPIESDGDRLGALVSLRQIGTRKKYEKQLERQNDRLSEFASVVAHDLRNPLNVADGNLEIAREECDSEHLDPAAEALSRMWAIIEDTLTLAKQGRYVGETERVSLSTVLEQCWTSVRTPEADLVIEDDVSILADPDRLRNLFENLFRNAVDHGSPDPEPSAPDDDSEHGGDGSSVTVRVGVLDETGFYVEDDGPGIPPEERDRAFDLGYSTSEDGTGYGLAIVRWIAEAHGWEVSVTEGTDGGARFEFTDVEFAG